jgi:hypothetical protein
MVAGLVACGALVAGAASDAPAPPSAHATVAVAMSVEEMVDASPAVVVVRAVERTSVWEELAGGRRIVTYTKLEVLETAYGDPASLRRPEEAAADDAAPAPADKPRPIYLRVRTLGGAVGRIGQQVAGEAAFKIGARSLAFLTRAGDGALVVTAMAQGQYPIAEPSDARERPRLRLVHTLATVLPRQGPSIAVQEALRGLELDQAVAKIREVKRQRDAAAPQR